MCCDTCETHRKKDVYECAKGKNKCSTKEVEKGKSAPMCCGEPMKKKR